MAIILDDLELSLPFPPVEHKTSMFVVLMKEIERWIKKLYARFYW